MRNTRFTEDFLQQVAGDFGIKVKVVKRNHPLGTVTLDLRGEETLKRMFRYTIQANKPIDLMIIYQDGEWYNRLRDWFTFHWGGH